MALPIDARPSQPMPDFSIQATSIDSATPRPSGVDYIRQNPLLPDFGSAVRRLGLKAAAGILVVTELFNGFGGGATAQSPTGTPDTTSGGATPAASLRSPDGSPTPDPRIAGICPPGYIYVEPSPSPSPELTPPVQIGIAEGRPLAQEAAATPEGGIEGIDVNGDGVVNEADDTNGDGVANEDDAQTAALLENCIPDPNTQSPEPSGEIATPTPEPLDPEKYTFKYLFEKEYNPIDRARFMEIVKEKAPIILQFTENDPDLDSLEKIINDYRNIADDTINNPNPDDATLIKFAIISHVNLARTFMHSNTIISDSLMDVAYAMLQLGQGVIDFNTEDPDKIDRRMDRLIRSEIQ